MNEFYTFFNENNYITNNEKQIIQSKFNNLYIKTRKNKLYIFSKTKRKFVKDFKNVDVLQKKNNSIYTENVLAINNDLLNNIKGFPLDSEQRRCVVDEEDNILVIAGAGSGKSLTIIGKIRYLIESKFFEENEILCISFTNDSTNSLKKSLQKNYNYNIDVLTFHKLALKIFATVREEINISDSYTLELIIDEFYEAIIYDYPAILKSVVYYFNNNDFNYFNEYKKIINTKKFIRYKKLLAQFIRLFKANVLNDNILINYLEKAKNNKKDYYFLYNIIIIFNIYQNELTSQKELDFDDMILDSIKIIDKYNLNLKYKYIIVDEYQDTSLIRCNLLQKIINKSNSKLMVVGDDFQSIYRFSGCNLDIFLNFNKYFSNPKIMYISNTYRNAQELIDIAGSFVMKNRLQIKKDLLSKKNLSKPIKIIYYNNQKEALKNLLLYLIQDNKKELLILGRNNGDIRKATDLKLENDYIMFDNIRIKYLTVHRSKGLEEENVIILNLENDVLGFPSKLEDDDILKYIVKYDDKISYEEERRLFYVSLTRTKNYNYLLVNENKPSIFVKEILRDYSEKIEILSIKSK